MQITIKLKKILFIAVLAIIKLNAYSQDPDFYIFLCLGQSNMEGQAIIQTQDMSVTNQFKVLATTNCSNLGRVKGSWYTATPPLCRCYTGLSPVDYFGRKLIANLPSNIKVGIVSVAVAGCKIELFDKDNYQSYVATAPSWMVSIINEYGGNPYAYLVEMAKLAQKDGVIKGILLHQGESNTGDNSWPGKVKGVYDNLLKDLNLKADSVPLLAGEVVNEDQGGICASMNSIIATLPQFIPTSYVISSKGCTDTTDNIHFNAAGYRELGKRYGEKMLSLLGYSSFTYLEPECATVGSHWERLADTQASNGKYVTVKTGFNSTDNPPSSTADVIDIPFTLNNDSVYYIFARVNCPTINDDSYWVKIDNGTFEKFDSLTTTGWQWMKLNTVRLSKGQHILSIAYGEDGARLDKICISPYNSAPLDQGDVAQNQCNLMLTTLLNATTTKDGRFIEAKCNKPITDPSAQLAAFKILINNTQTSIDSLRLKSGNDSVMVFAPTTNIKNGDIIKLYYTAGDITATDGIGLVSFAGYGITNTVPALALVSAATSTSGKIVYAVCNKPMNDPSAYLSSFRIYLNSSTSAYALDSVRLKPDNDSVLAVYLSNPVASTDAVKFFHYSGYVTSKEGIKLATYRFFNVTNNTLISGLRINDVPQQLTVYSSATGENIYIKGIKGYQKICIYNTSGRLLSENKRVSALSPVKVSNLPAGIYILTAYNEHGQCIKGKFIKNN